MSEAAEALLDIITPATASAPSHVLRILGGLSWMSQALTFGWLVHSGGDRCVRSRVEHGNAKLDVLKGEVGIAAVHTHTLIPGLQYYTLIPGLQYTVRHTH